MMKSIFCSKRMPERNHTAHFTHFRCCYVRECQVLLEYLAPHREVLACSTYRSSAHRFLDIKYLLVQSNPIAILWKAIEWRSCHFQQSPSTLSSSSSPSVRIYHMPFAIILIVEKMREFGRSVESIPLESPL